MKIATQGTFADVSPEYAAFVEKFKPKKTTDDCYTPKPVYDAILKWCAWRYALPESTVVCRPFLPGGDYERFDYPDGCIVVDNPPFSILSPICSFYRMHGIRFFLFAPAMSCFLRVEGTCAVCASAAITYENGAVVRTSFITDMEPDYVARTAPSLFDAIDAANDENLKKVKKSVPKYEFPMHVVTAAKLGWMSVHHTDLRIRRSEAARITSLDAMDAAGKSGIFGGGYLLAERAAAERAAAERAAAERAAAERAAAERWKLSDRELAMVAMLGK